MQSFKENVQPKMKRMKKQEIETYDKLHGQIYSMKLQFEALSKKNPDGVVNEFKIGLVNKLLEEANNLIGDYKPFPEFVIFDNSPKVFNSDVLIMLAQYLTAMGRYKEANTKTEKRRGIDTEWLDTVETWNTED